MEFNIRPAAKCCAKTGQPFRSGDVCWSILIEKTACWCVRTSAARPGKGHRRKRLVTGGSQIAESTDTSRPKLDADSLFDYFLQLSDSPNIVQQQYRYVLALLLLRKRRLVLEEVVEFDDRPTMRLVGSAGEGPFDVPEEELNEEQIERLQQQLFDSGRAIAA